MRERNENNFDFIFCGCGLPTKCADQSNGVSVSNKTKIKNFGGKGVVTKINLELVSGKLDQEEIKA